MCCELRFLAFLGSISEQYQTALCDMARRSVGHGQKGASGTDALRTFLAERLIALGAGAVFAVAPVCILLSGFGLPGTYGAAAAIALTYVAIPFLALGWLSISSTPWMAGLFALASWSALAGALVAISPLLALTSGLVLFQVAGGTRTAERIRALIVPAERAAPAAEAEDAEIAAEDETTTLELTPEGVIERVAGHRDTIFRPHRLFIDHVHLADRIAFLGALSDVAKARKTVAPVSVRVNLAKSGEPQSFKTVRAELLPSAAGVSLALHEPAAQTDEQAAASEEGTAVQKRFLATVSHELRTPLNSIIGFSDILRRDLFGALANDRQREYVELIHSSGTHLLSVVNTILDLSKIDAGTYGIQREPFDLNGMAGECISMLKPQADAKGLTLDFVAAPEIAQADGDRRAIKQVVLNLLSNAVKFSEPGGIVRLSTERRERGVLISVSDTGIGMTGEELATIGTPFMQADNSYTRTCEGTGLGLTVVMGIVQLHGGTLDVESEPGEGTRVTVFIPESASRIAGTRGHQIEAEELSTARRLQGETNRKVNGNAVRLAG